jgi:4-amino-4-deoxy-L-arabinose transferase-like glycosyltransferase
MKSSLRPAATALALAVATFALYAFHLGRAPIYLAHDEVIFALNARAIALTGHDVTGRHWPLYVGHYWATPLNIYFTALFLRFAALSETVVRLPTVVVGTIDVVLMYLIARRLFARDATAVAAAALLALTPVHLIHSRLGVDHLYPLPFVMLWLLGLLAFLDTGRRWMLFGATLSLGVGFYSYLASVVMMPVFFAVTIVMLAVVQRGPMRTHFVAAAGFVLPLAPLVPWHLRHPTQFAQQLAAYGLYDPARGSPLRGLRSLLSLPSISTRAGVYYNFFNPSLLFLTGDTSIVNSTRAAGVFLWPFAVFIPIGVYAILKRRQPTTLLVLLGFAVSPLAAVAVGEVMINRALVMVPFAVVIAAVGIEYLLTSAGRTWRAAAIALLVLAPLQCAGVYVDYLTAYRVRSSRWFERNIRGAVEAVVARDRQSPLPAVYVSSEIVWIDEYWRFYLAKAGREDLLTRTVRFNPRADDVQAMPWQSVLLANFDPSRDEPLVDAGKLFRIAVVSEPDNAPSFSILGRN